MLPRARARRRRSTVRGPGPSRRSPSGGVRSSHDQRLSTESWELSWLHADGCSGSSTLRSRAGRSSGSTWSQTPSASANSTWRFSTTDEPTCFATRKFRLRCASPPDARAGCTSLSDQTLADVDLRCAQCVVLDDLVAIEENHKGLLLTL